MARTTAGPTSEQRRVQILDAAMRVFAEKGFTDTTNKDIAREAGVTAPLLYYYFRTKRDLFEAILNERVTIGEASALLTSEAVDSQPARAVLRRFMLDLLSRMQKNHDSPAFRAMMQEAFHDAEARELFSQKMLGTHRALAAYLARMAAGDRIRPLNPSAVSTVILGSIASYAIHQQGLEAEVSSEVLIDTIAAMVVDSIPGNPMQQASIS